MNRLCSMFVALVVMGASLAMAQTKPEEPRSVSQVMDRAVKSVESEFVPAAEAMPEDKYAFAPTNGEFKGVRTFAQQVKHVAAVNYLVAADMMGEKPPVELGGESGPDAVKTKADIVKFLKDSFALGHKAAATLTAENMLQSPGNSKSTRLRLATFGVAHAYDHYGQMVEYLRMNGIVPPASRGK